MKVFQEYGEELIGLARLAVRAHQTKPVAKTTGPANHGQSGAVLRLGLGLDVWVEGVTAQVSRHAVLWGADGHAF